jgi:hypothetical protein
MADNYLMNGPQTQPRLEDARRRVALLNSGQVQPGVGDPQFGIRLAQQLEAERLANQQIVLQQQQAHDALMSQLPQQSQPNGISDVVPSDRNIPNWLVGMSQRSPRGRIQQSLNAYNGDALSERLAYLQTHAMPAEIGSPGYKGKLFELFRGMLGDGQF